MQRYLFLAKTSGKFYGIQQYSIDGRSGGGIEMQDDIVSAM